MHDDRGKAAQDGPLLEVAGLTVAFGDLIVLDGVSFTLEPGCAAAVVGPNGSGKTTLLSCVAGAAEVDEGEILLDCAVLDGASPAARAAIASALDDIAFFPDLSVGEHLRLFSWAHGMRSPDDVVTAVLLASHDEELVAAVADTIVEVGR